MDRAADDAASRYASEIPTRVGMDRRRRRRRASGSRNPHARGDGPPLTTSATGGDPHARGDGPRRELAWPRETEIPTRVGMDRDGQRDARRSWEIPTRVGMDRRARR